MAMSEAKRRANKKWNDANQKERYDRINVLVPKGAKETIAAAAATAGESISQYILTATQERMNKEKQEE